MKRLDFGDRVDAFTVLTGHHPGFRGESVGYAVVQDFFTTRGQAGQFNPHREVFVVFVLAAQADHPLYLLQPIADFGIFFLFLAVKVRHQSDSLIQLQVNVPIVDAADLFNFHQLPTDVFDQTGLMTDHLIEIGILGVISKQFRLQGGVFRLGRLVGLKLKIVGDYGTYQNQSDYPYARQRDYK